MVKKNQDKKAGRVAMTQEQKDEKFNVYVKKIESRNKLIDEENKGKEEKDQKKLNKLLDRDAWNKSMPSGESSEELFIRLTKTRMPKVLKAINNVTNLSHYQHTDKQTEKIISDLQKAVDTVKTSFSMKSENKEIEEEYQI